VTLLRSPLYKPIRDLPPLLDPGDFGDGIERRVILEAGVLVIRIVDVIAGIRTPVQTPVDA
jgi:hypothetical protein